MGLVANAQHSGQDLTVAWNDLDRHEPPRGGMHLRWLAANLLIGLIGGGLLGASLYIALDGSNVRPEAARSAVASVSRPTSRNTRPVNVARKSDRLNRSEPATYTKLTYRAPMTFRTGSREVIKDRQFVRIATNLSQIAGIYTSDIPPLNPMRLLAENRDERLTDTAPEPSDIDVSIVRRDLALVAVDVSAPSLTDDDVLVILEEERRLAAETGRRTSASIPPQQLLSRMRRQPGDFGDALGYASMVGAPFSTIEVKVIPENVTNLVKDDLRTGSPLIEERDVVLAKGETLESVLRAYGGTPDQALAITAALSARIMTADLAEGQRIRILIAPGPRLGDSRQIVRVTVFGERGIEAVAATNDRGTFVSVTPPNDQKEPETVVAREEEKGDDEGGIRLYESLYETVLKNDLPRQTVDELVRIFGYDVDFQERVGPGDALEVLYGVDDEGGQERPEILYVALNIGGETKRAYHYAAPDGSVSYLDEQGRSLKKFLLRKPIADGILRSGFGPRRHPILGYTRPHTGVDWANRTGTPILAAGAGTVIKAGWDGGYGRRIEIQHANGYVTAYSHQSKFAAGIAVGERVRQGQVIGYVGNTGLSTGPHLHYEVLVNGSFIDALKIRVGRESELAGDLLTGFEQERAQIEALFNRATPPLAFNDGSTQ